MVETASLGKCENPCNNWCQADVMSCTQDSLQFISDWLQTAILTFFPFHLLAVVCCTFLPQTQCEVVQYLIRIPDRAHNVLLVA